MAEKKRKKIVEGIVWAGFTGEYKKSPIYIIPKPDDDGIFVDDILKGFVRRKVRLTIEEV